jgi:uncharacterized protein (DUF433 family)
VAGTKLAINLIASDPDVRGGRPVVDGTGICVSDIAAATIFHQQTPDEIAVGYRLSLSQVHAALAYYYEHKDEIDREIKQRSERSADMKDKRVGSRHPLLFG